MPRTEPEVFGRAGERQTFERHVIVIGRLQIDAAERCRTLLDEVGAAAGRDLGDGNALEIVFDRAEVPQSTGGGRAARVRARKYSFETAESGARESGTWDETLHTQMNLIAAWIADDLDQAAQQSAEGYSHRIPQHLDTVHRLEREVEARRARGRIGDVESVEQQRRLVRPCASHS